ncbi:MAG: hypothetical protein M5U26_12510 [Planctomycetota bacterium]|nr:hypothetical protein [Planctomycetota bacterium]
MQDNGPLIALIFFIIFTAVCGLFAYQRYQELMGDDPEGVGGRSTKLDAEIKEKKDDLATVGDETRGWQFKIEEKRAAIQVQVDRLNRFDRLYKDFESAHKGRTLIVDAGKRFRGAATDLGGRVAEKKDETRTTIRKDESDLRERTDSQVRELDQSRENAVSRAIEEKKKHETRQKTFRVQKNYEDSTVDEYRRQLDALTQREVERAHVADETDGKVILSDPVHNTVVINIGTVQGVKNGFRFECFAMRPGNRKVHKAFLEVRKASASLSECMIVTTTLQLPRDPLSDYVAPEPEYRYSPYHESGKKGSTLQPLSASVKETTLGMNKLDPIVEGDLVQNPFFAPNKTFTFYIAGSKAIAQGVQKSAIAYSWVQIKSISEFYGAKVVDVVDLGVNYIIAQKNAREDDPEFTKAVTLGIPVIYEWELFRFLDQR